MSRRRDVKSPSICWIALLGALLAAGCYNPSFKNGLACDPAGACPAGTTCRTDGKCHPVGEIADAAPGGAIDAATLTDATLTDATLLDAGATIDGATTIDASPTGCAVDADCATPSDLCSTAGTCNLSTHVCVFPPKDCAASADECNAGTCNPATGLCGKSPTDGVVCGAKASTVVAGSCAACNYGSTCGETAPDVSCMCAIPICRQGSCSATTVPVACMQACSNRDTNGTTCGPCDPSFIELICSGGTCSAAQSCGNQ